MGRKKLGTQPSEIQGTLHSSPAGAAAPSNTDFEDNFDDLFEDDTDFDVEDDIAFLGEDYDVMELDDVLELCKVGRDDIYDA